MENKSTFYIYPDSDNWWFPNSKNTFFDSKIKNIKIGNTKIPKIIGTKTFNLKEFKKQVNEVFKEKRNRLEKQLSKLEAEYKIFQNQYDNTLKYLDLVKKDKSLSLTIEVII